MGFAVLSEPTPATIGAHSPRALIEACMKGLGVSQLRTFHFKDQNLPATEGSNGGIPVCCRIDAQLDLQQPSEFGQLFHPPRILSSRKCGGPALVGYLSTLT